MELHEALQTLTDHATIKWENLSCARIHSNGSIPICDRLTDSIRYIEQANSINIRTPKVHKIDLDTQEFNEIVDNRLRSVLIDHNANLKVGDKVEFKSFRLINGYGNSAVASGLTTTALIIHIQKYEDKTLVHFRKL